MASSTIPTVLPPSLEDAAAGIVAFPEQISLTSFLRGCIVKTATNERGAKNGEVEKFLLNDRRKNNSILLSLKKHRRFYEKV